MKNHDALGRVSRYSNGRIDDGKDHRITLRDLDILSLLQTYAYLPSTYIAALLGISLDQCQRNLRKLRRNFGAIHVPENSWPRGSGNYRPAVYALTEVGYRLLRQHGRINRRPRKRRELYHELGVALIQASFALGAREHGLDLIAAEDMLAHPNCPAATKQLREPFVLRTTFDYALPKSGTTERITREVETDGTFFGLARRFGATRRTLIIPGFEFDRETEPLRPEQYDRPFIAGKFLAQRQLAREEQYEKRFGFPKGCLLYPFITLSAEHEARMLRLLERLTGGHGSKLFIFASLPDFSTFDRFPPPTGWALTRPWTRTGHPPLNLLAELGVTSRDHA